MSELNKIYNGDCLTIMNDIENKSIDMILCDLPYGTTNCSWDIIIPFDQLWKQYNRIIKDNGAILLTAIQPFSSMLVMSNLKLFKYEWIWRKQQGTGFLNAKKQPLRETESILVFYKNQPNYNPQKIKIQNKRKGIVKANEKNNDDSVYRKDITGKVEWIDEGYRYPKNIIEKCFDSERFDSSNKNRKYRHPTQKPIALFEYLIKTYSNEGNLILDNTSGSGTTAIACLNLNRNYICIEKDDTYYNLSIERVKNHIKMKPLNNTEFFNY